MGKAGRPKCGRKELNEREMIFAECYIKTHNKSQAYRTAGYSIGKMNSTQIASNAQRIFNRPLVSAEIKRLEAAAEEARAEAYKNDYAAQLSRWSRDDSLDALREIVGVARDAMRKPVRDDDGNITDYTFDASAARVARDAVESLNKMQGYNEPEKSEVDAVISVAFADGGEYTG